MCWCCLLLCSHLLTNGNTGALLMLSLLSTWAPLIFLLPSLLSLSCTQRPPWISVWQHPAARAPPSFHLSSPLFSLSHKKTSFSLSEPLCWPPPGFPPSFHLFPPTFNGSLTSIFTVSCCSGQHFFFNYTPLWMVLTKISFYFHLQCNNIVHHPNYFWLC